ncbi:MAG: hypothetical protein FJ267_07345, partial [Planctomycetes bacterium]|nr:hypothetical protein [Planctomycetota bacterium]
VVNEPFDNNAVMAILGDSVVNDWFGLVRTLSPNTERVLNDYDIFARNGNNTSHRANFDYWLGRLKSNDGNNANDFIERIGEQGHYNEGNLTDIAVLGQLLQTYHTQHALPIGITEFDFNTTDRQLQADYLRDFLTMCFSQSGVDEFIQWGFWSGRHWLPEAALYNLDFSIRPNGQVYEDLVFGNWWTDTRATTRNGTVSSEIFKGNYEITVTHGNHTITRTLNAFSADGAMTVELDILPPAVLALAPSDNAINVPLSSNLVLTFNESVVKGTGNILIRKTLDNSIVQSIPVSSTAVSITGAVVTIDPSDFSENTRYYVSVDTTAFKDQANNPFAGIAGTTAWNFRTNESPIIIDQTLPAVAENSVSGTVVGVVTASDPDAGQVLSFAITGGNTGEAFAINPSTGQITVANLPALDFETKPVYDLTVQVTDNGVPRLTTSATVTVNLLNQFEITGSALQSIVPLYQYPLSAPNTLNDWWQRVLVAATPDRPVTVIINPDNGPFDPASGGDDYNNYLIGLSMLRANPGVRILGYVATGFGTTPQATIMQHAGWYTSGYKHNITGASLIDGIFLDEMSNNAAHVAGYSNVANGIRALNGLAGHFIAGNPGTTIPEEYLIAGVADLFVIREGTIASLFANPAPAFVTAPVYDHLAFGAIVHSVA